MSERATDTTTPASTGQALRRHPELLRITVLAFASGLPLALSGGTLQAWLADVRIDIRTIGIFSRAVIDSITPITKKMIAISP